MGDFVLWGVFVLVVSYALMSNHNGYVLTKVMYEQMNPGKKYPLYRYLYHQAVSWPGRVMFNVRAQYAWLQYLRWKHQPIPEDDMDPALAYQQPFVLHLGLARHNLYLEELVRRRKIAHERDIARTDKRIAEGRVSGSPHEAASP